MSCMNHQKGMQDVASSAGFNEMQDGGNDITRRQAPPSAQARRRHDQNKLLHESMNNKEQPAVQVQIYGAGDSVLVAVNAAKMSRDALQWALNNVVQPGDNITLLVLCPAGGKKLWSLPLISGDCARRAITRKGPKTNGKLHDTEEEISDNCACMVQEMRTLCNSKKAKVSIKVVPDEERGAIALEADKIGAAWVVLDKHVMKKEGKICLEQLQCNLVLVKQSKNSKILRLNLKGSMHSRATPPTATAAALTDDATSHENWEPDGSSGGLVKRASATRRASRLSNAAKRKAKIRSNSENFSYYDGAASSESSPDVVNKGTDPFTTGSETDSTAAARGAVHYISALCAELQLNSDNELLMAGAVSDYGDQLDFLYSGDQLGDHGELHRHDSGLLCTPASVSPVSPPPPSLVTDPGFEPSSSLTADHSEGMRIGLFNREAWKPAPSCMITTCQSSKPNSANTTPKSETLTFTGSSYPKTSRSPSPSSINQHVPARSRHTNQQPPRISSATNQHAPPAPISNPHAVTCNARASRSPSPSKSNCGASSVKQSSPSDFSTTSSNPRSKPHLITSAQLGSSQSVITCSSKPASASRRHDFLRCTRQLDAVSAPDPTLSVTKAESTIKAVTTRELMQRFSEWDHQGSIKSQRSSSSSTISPTNSNVTSFLNLYSETPAEVVDLDSVNDLERTSSVRRAMSILGRGGCVLRPAPPGPPPLCSICQHKAPVFGKPPRRFSYAELELATGGFSKANFLAEGGFGSVHRGVLPDGQAVAVKQHKVASSQGDIEFCSEVEVLSCAQHRNVVMLIGYCIEDRKRLLVYEFICNGSLDSHLYGSNQEPLPWVARQKVAVGGARGLRYLHEECRVGCIIHRDMRPNNILLTHDYEPMVGDFGLARWQPDGDLGVQTRVIGTFGYLAPEYAQSGEVTEKADVYSFGVVLLELVTGRKAVDLARPKGEQCLTEWARPLLEEGAQMQQLLDPRLQGHCHEYELFCSLHAASLCIRKDPHLRPRMSQVLRILEGDVIIDTSGPPTPLYFQGGPKLVGMYQAAEVHPGSFNGSQSSRFFTDYQQRGDTHTNDIVSPPLVSYSGSLLTNNTDISFNHAPLRNVFSFDQYAFHSSYLPPSSHNHNKYSKRLSFEES